MEGGWEQNLKAQLTLPRISSFNLYWFSWTKPSLSLIESFWVSIVGWRFNLGDGVSRGFGLFCGSWGCSPLISWTVSCLEEIQYFKSALTVLTKDDYIKIYCMINNNVNKVINIAGVVNQVVWSIFVPINKPIASTARSLY